jgi:arabinose-5-phosphate isomerase
MGDAIAVALLQARGFTEQDFAFSHPGGSLGKKLLLTVDDIMHKGAKIPVVNDSDSLFTALEEMSAKGLGMTTVVDAQGQLVGLFTDGDIRRHLDKPLNIHQTSISDVMTQGGLTIKPNALAAEALQLMETRKINGLIVVDEQQRPIGVFNMHDLLRAGIL